MEERCPGAEFFQIGARTETFCRRDRASACVWPTGSDLSLNGSKSGQVVFCNIDSIRFRAGKEIDGDAGHCLAAPLNRQYRDDRYRLVSRNSVQLRGPNDSLAAGRGETAK